jgi:hypothetical protein
MSCVPLNGVLFSVGYGFEIGIQICESKVFQISEDSQRNEKSSLQRSSFVRFFNSGTFSIHIRWLAFGWTLDP